MSEPIRGIVFDKDGTLFDFHATWSVWFADFIPAVTGGDAAKAAALAEALHFDLGGSRFAPTSPMIAGTMDDFDIAVRSILPELDAGDLRRLILTSTAAAQQVEATPLIPLLDRLLASGLTLGVATNNSEYPARSHLNAPASSTASPSSPASTAATAPSPSPACSPPSATPPASRLPPAR